MTIVFASEDLAEDYSFILRTIRDKGDEVSPRGLLTRELLSFTLELRDPQRSLVRGTERKIHTGLAAAEALQLIGGFSDPGAMQKVSPHFEQFMDGGVFHAPYGPRVATQIQEAINWMKRDADTRKAWVQVWNPLQDLWTHDTRDHPCTTAFQFMIRQGKLNMHVFMRANDAWRGFPYDVFQFTQLQQAVAECMWLELGTYYHHATSMHLYEDNLEAIDRLISSSQPPVEGVKASPHSQFDWAKMQNDARNLFYGTAPLTFGSGEELMFNALRRAGIEGEW